MMCLGWYNRPTCAARQPVNAETGESMTAPNQITTAAPCPSALWFWLSAAAIVLGGAIKKG